MWANVLSNIRKVIVSDGIGVTFHDVENGEPTDCVLQDIKHQVFDQYKNVYYSKVPYRDAVIDSGIGIYTPEDVINVDSWRNSVFYNELIVPTKRTEIMLLDVINQKQLLLKFSFFKEPQNGEFTDNDKLFLQFLYPHIVQSYKKSLLFNELRKVDNILHLAFEKMHRPYVIIDAKFKLIHASAAVKELCAVHEQSIDTLIDLLRKPAEPVIKTLSVSGFGFQFTNISLWDIRYRLTVVRIEQTDLSSYYILAFDTMSDQLSKTVVKCSDEFGLSNREIDICIMMMKGLSNHDIAEALYISEYTVKDHLKSIFIKLKVNSRSMAIAKLFGSV
jgi:DNA-binding CsgD family transcriptional regulator